MRNKIKKAIGETLQGLVDMGVETSFTEREMKMLNVKVPVVDITPDKIKEIRQAMNTTCWVTGKM